MPRPANPDRTFKFTDRKLNSLPLPKDGKQVDYFDTQTRGLGLRISYGGRRTWFVMYRDSSGKRCRFGLGEPGKIEDGRVSLLGARETAKRKIGEVASGKSPAAELAAARMAETVSELAVDFIESQKRRQLKSWERQRVILDDNVLPSIGGIKVRDVRRADIKSMLRKIADRPAPVLSNRAHEVVRKMFNFALDEETYGVEYNPALRIQREIETPRDRWLSLKEIAAYWRALDQEKPGVAAALKLLLVTAQRQQNVLSMRWSQIDLDDALWEIPAAETKSSQVYVVPLAPLALEILEGLKGESDFVFKKNDEDAPVSRTFIDRPHSRVCKRAGIENYAPHDDRHTFSTHAAKMGIPEFIRGRVLGHTTGGSITSRYSHYDYADEKRGALCRWADKITTAVSDNVIELSNREGAA